MGTEEEFVNDFCRTIAEILIIEESKKKKSKIDVKITTLDIYFP